MLNGSAISTRHYVVVPAGKDVNSFADLGKLGYYAPLQSSQHTQSRTAASGSISD